MVGVKSLLSLESPAAKTCRFLMCIGTYLFVSKSFQKMLFYHCTLCTDIFLANDWFYYLFYGWKIRLLKRNSEKQLWRKESSWTCAFFQNSSCKPLFLREHLRFNLLFQKYFLHFCWISVYNQRINAIVLRRTRFRCSRVFRWCYVGVPLLFRDVPLFRHYI